MLSHSQNRIRPFDAGDKTRAISKMPTLAVACAAEMAAHLTDGAE